MKISKTRLENMTYKRRWQYLIRGCGRKAQERFMKFHEANQHIYLALMNKADEQWDEHWRKSSVWLILNIIRWGPGTTIDTDSEYRIDNNYFAYYARLLIAHQPKFANWIEIKSFKGQKDDNMEDRN